MRYFTLILGLLAATCAQAQTTLDIGQKDTTATTSSNAQVWPGCASNCMSVNPAYVMLPGASRRVWTNVCTGTNVWGGTGSSPTLPACTQPASTAVTWTLNSGPCTVPGGQTIGFGTITTTAGGTTGLCSITATTVQDNAVSLTFHVLKVVAGADALGPSASMSLHTCGAQTGVATCVDVMPFYEVLYTGQYADLQAYVGGKVDTTVTWAVSPNNGGLTFQNGTSNRDAALLAVNAGTYTVTATSVADGTAAGSAKVVVTANLITGQTRTSKVIPIDCTPEGSGTTYNVTDDTSFAAVAWDTLGPGDTVTIHAKASQAAYAIPFQIKTSGTPTQPIRVCGIPDGSGNLPILTGVNSGPGNVTAAMQPYGMVIVRVNGFQHLNCSVGGTCTQPPEPDPHSIIIEGLSINGAVPGSARTGGAAAFFGIASGIRVQGRDVIFRGNETTNNGNGVYSQSDTTLEETQMTRRLTIEGNYIHGNGTVGGFSQHENYLQGEMLLYQWNWVGIERAGAFGGSVKVRMPYSVIRYNYIQANARLLDLVELQDWYDYGISNCCYYGDNQPTSSPSDPISIADVANITEHLQSIYVYGNIMDNNANNGNSASFPIHWFPDVFANREHGGIMYMYGNTFREEQDASGALGNGIDLIDSTRIGPLPQVWPQSRLTNNAIDIECATVGCGNGNPTFSFVTAYQDIVALDKNWITNIWNTSPYGSGPTSAWTACCASPSAGGNTCFQGTCNDNSNTNNITGTGSLITGASVPFNATTFIPVNGSPLLNAAVALPAAVSDMPPEFNYQPNTQGITLRADIVANAPTTIGASGLAGGGGGGGNPPPTAAPTRLGVLLMAGNSKMSGAAK